MKTTYLIYKQVDGIRQLVVATQEEWDAILKENRRCGHGSLGQRNCWNYIYLAQSVPAQTGCVRSTNSVIGQ